MAENPEKISGEIRAIPSSTVVLEVPRSRATVEIERMTKGPAKITVRIDGDDTEKLAEEALSIYEHLVEEVAVIEGGEGENPEGKTG